MFCSKCGTKTVEDATFYYKFGEKTNEMNTNVYNEIDPVPKNTPIDTVSQQTPVIPASSSTQKNEKKKKG